MARHYANLDWMVEHRKVDLPRLRLSTEEALRSAHGRWRARRALERFIAAFRDPHLRLVNSSPASPMPGAEEETAGGRVEAPTCSDRSFSVRDRGFIFPFEQAEGWERAGGPWFPAGSFGAAGVIRIAHFGEDGYREACDEVGPDHVRERLQEELRDTIRELRERAIRVLIVDITGNGGGTGWATEAVSLFATGTLHRPKARGLSFECDRTPIWDGEAVCPGIAGEGESVFQAEGVWEGPLAVLVDGRTASASEDFVVWLRESGAATIIGERTYGAGCGYANGGAPARLDRIGLTVLMPNCARFTSDGVNEVEGIAPDVHLSLREGSAAQRLAGLIQSLP
jgi:hypothetical protein